jgi:hypothetical protein
VGENGLAELVLQAVRPLIFHDFSTGGSGASSRSTLHCTMMWL